MVCLSPQAPVGLSASHCLCVSPSPQASPALPSSCSLSLSFLGFLPFSLLRLSSFSLSSPAPSTRSPHLSPSHLYHCPPSLSLSPPSISLCLFFSQTVPPTLSLPPPPHLSPILLSSLTCFLFQRLSLSHRGSSHLLTPCRPLCHLSDSEADCPSVPTLRLLGLRAQNQLPTLRRGPGLGQMRLDEDQPAVLGALHGDQQMSAGQAREPPACTPPPQRGFGDPS